METNKPDTKENEKLKLRKEERHLEVEKLADRKLEESQAKLPIGQFWLQDWIKRTKINDTTVIHYNNIDNQKHNMLLGAIQNSVLITITTPN